MNSPISQYKADCKKGVIHADPEQQRVLRVFEKLYHCVLAKHSKQKTLFSRVISRFKKQKPCQGIYLWGSVGIGKTYLLDLFYDALPHARKRRLHFHQFMQQVHAELKRLQGEQDPLAIIARHFSMQADVLCFDEFVVTDIADAMLLSGLLNALSERGVILVATSNTPPEQLYAQGLQRQRFLPAIELLNQHTQVLHLATQADYRLKALARSGVYFTPADSAAAHAMQHCFTELTHGGQVEAAKLEINGRTIDVVALGSEVVWFDFAVLCAIPRSQLDYLEIAKRYHTVLLSNVPCIAPGDLTTVTYLIHLIDILYDHRVKLILSAAGDIDALYPVGDKGFEFTRTRSRLHEMQSNEYLHQGHLTF